VHHDALGLSVRRVARVLPRVGRLGALDEQEAGGRLTLLGDHADATP